MLHNNQGVCGGGGGGGAMGGGKGTRDDAIAVKAPTTYAYNMG